MRFALLAIALLGLATAPALAQTPGSTTGTPLGDLLRPDGTLDTELAKGAGALDLDGFDVSMTASGLAARAASTPGWSPYADARPSVPDGTVRAAAVASDGTLYIGGDFEAIAGTPYAHIASWDGTAWSAVGTGLNGTVRDLLIEPDGTLYAAGDFTNAGGPAGDYVAAWNGTAWSALGTGLNGPAHVVISGPDGTFYAGGAFSTAGGVSASRIAQFSGSAWSAVGTGVAATTMLNNAGGEPSTVYALAVDTDGTVYAGGDFDEAGGVSANGVAAYNGTAWSALGTGLGKKTTTPRQSGDLSAREFLIADDGTLYVVGAFILAGGVQGNNVSAWDGTAWSSVGSLGYFGNSLGQNNATAYALAEASDGTLYAAGFLPISDGGASVGLKRFTGSFWQSAGLFGAAVYDLAVDPAGDLYAVGDMIDPIVAYDGTDFSAVGLSTFDGTINVTVTAPDGTVYAAGDFANAPGTAANSIAAYDGTAWTALGAGLDGPVEALAVAPDGTLYAGGSFDTAGGVAAARIARWTGTAWERLGAGLASVGSSDVVDNLIAAPDGSVYASGRFRVSTMDCEERNLAQWDGTQWNALGCDSDPVYDIARSESGILYGVLTLSRHVHVWNGASWDLLGGVDRDADRIAAIGEGLVAAEDNLLHIYDGTQWQDTFTMRTGATVGFGIRINTVRDLAVDPRGMVYIAGLASGEHLGTTLETIASFYLPTRSFAFDHKESSTSVAIFASLNLTDAGDLIVSGSFGSVDGAEVRNLALYTPIPIPQISPTLPDSDAWTALGDGVNGLVTAAAVGLDGQIYIGGSFTSAGGVSANRIAVWDGSAWGALGSGMNNTVRALALAPDGTLYAVGSFSTAGGVPASRVARWDGTAWNALGSGLNRTTHAVTVAPDGTLYVGGDFFSAGGSSASRIAAYNPAGETWSPLGSGINSSVRALALGLDGTLYVGGLFSAAGGISAQSIAAWDGSTWSALGSGSFNKQVDAIHVGGDGTVYAGGVFTVAGGMPANRVAAWDGSSWSALGAGVGGNVASLAVDPLGTLYAGGSFTTAGGDPASFVARWDGQDWSALSAGTNGGVLALAHDRIGGLITGGAFTTAGGAAADRVARWQTPYAITLSGGEGWRMLAASTTQVPLTSLLGPIWTQGMPGSDAPDADPDAYCNVFLHDETVRTDLNNDGVVSTGDGWSCAQTLDTVLDPGDGILVYVYADDDNDGTPDAFPKVLPIGGGVFRPLADLPFAVDGLSYTDSPLLPDVQEGFNYVGNPTPLALDADLFTTEDLAATTYVWDPTLFGGDYRTWNGGAGELANGIVPPAQGFFVQATAASPTLTIPAEAAKTSGLPVYGRTAAAPVVRFELARADGTAEASAFVHLDDAGTPGLDRLDGLRLTPMRWPYAALYTRAPGAKDSPPLVVNALARQPEALDVPLGVQAAGYRAGLPLALTWDGFALPEGWSSQLVDTATGASYDLSQPGRVDFELAGSAGRQAAASVLSLRPDALRADASAERFIVRIASSSAVSNEGDAITEFAVGVPYPNPVQRAATVPVELATAGAVRVSVVDMLGREVAVALDAERPAGRHAVALDTESLAAGAYLVRVVAGEDTATRRIQVVR